LATVKILDTLTFSRSVALARSAESASLSSFGTYFFVKEKCNEYYRSNRSIKLYTVDRLGKGWTSCLGWLRAGRSIRMTNMNKNIYTMGKEYFIHSVRAACYGLDKIP
jgi:hypothetical protein